MLLLLGVACFVAGGGVKSWRPSHLRFIVVPLAALLAAFLLSTVASQVHSLSAIALLTVARHRRRRAGSSRCSSRTSACARRSGRSIADRRCFLLAVRVILWRRDEGLNVVAFQVLNNAWQGKLQLAWVFNLFAPLLLARAMGEPRRSLAALYGFTWAVTGVATYLLFSRMGSIVFAVTTLGVWIFNPASMAQGAR